MICDMPTLIFKDNLKTFSVIYEEKNAEIIFTFFFLFCNIDLNMQRKNKKRYIS